MTRPALGVMLFSLGGLVWRRRLTLPQCLEQVAGLGPDQGIELIGAQSLPSYPEVSADDVRSFRKAVDRTGVVPVSYCAYLERARSRSRVLTPVQAVPLLEQEIATARRLGFPMLRLNTATPDVLRALAPISERTGVTLVVELATEPRTDPAVRALLEELDRLDCPGLGVIQDFSAFVRAVPAPFVEATAADGTPREAMAAVVDAWTAGRPLAEALDSVRALPGLDAAGLGLAAQAAHITYALFRGGSPEGLRDVLPHLRHVQAKFFATAPDGSEPCVPYAELLPILRDGGYRGRLHSEFEGFLWSDDLDALAEISRQQQYLTRLWEEAPAEPATGP
jgi:sugar phosphate isomerase/epimerase